MMEVLVGKLMVNEVSRKPYTYLIVDFITKLLLVVEKDIILVVCNRLSKMAYFVATTEDTMVDNIWTLHRLPESVISDKRPQFAVKLTKELNNMLGI